jgi:two-component sensor histidine kinase
MREDGSLDNDLASPNRLRSLALTGLMDTAPEPGFDRITRLVRRALTCEVSLISLVDEKRQFFKSHCGIPQTAPFVRGTPISHSFCQNVVTMNRPLIVNDAHSDDLFRTHPAVRDLNVIAYLGMPITGQGGYVVGSLCAIKNHPHTWTEDEIESISDFAGLVDELLARRAEVTDAISHAETSNVVAREYQHRVKNALAVASSLLRLSSREAQSIRELVSMTDSRLASLASAQDLLAHDRGQVDLKSLVTTVLKPFENPKCEAGPFGEPLTLQKSQVMPMVLMLHELATNSAKYGTLKNDGKILVAWHVEDKYVVFSWKERTELPVGQQTNEAGFGSKLFETVAVHLHGKLQPEMTATGFELTVRFPLMPAVSA